MRSLRLLHYFNAFSKLNACLLGQYEVKQYQYSFFNEYLIYDDSEINISLRDEEYADEPNLEMKEVGQAQENI